MIFLCVHHVVNVHLTVTIYHIYEMKDGICWSKTMGTYYHVTDVRNLDSIFQDGLVPQIGSLSKQLGDTGEAVSAIFLFTSDEACIDAMGSWLGEAFDELDEEKGEESHYAVLRVELDDYDDADDDGIFYEKAVYKRIIPPDRISICRGIACDFDYDEKWFFDRYGKYVR